MTQTQFLRKQLVTAREEAALMQMAASAVMQGGLEWKDHLCTGGGVPYAQYADSEYFGIRIFRSRGLGGENSSTMFVTGVVKW